MQNICTGRTHTDSISTTAWNQLGNAGAGDQIELQSSMSSRLEPVIQAETWINSMHSILAIKPTDLLLQTAVEAIGVFPDFSSSASTVLAGLRSQCFSAILIACMQHYFRNSIEDYLKINSGTMSPQFIYGFVSSALLHCVERHKLFLGGICRAAQRSNLEDVPSAFFDSMHKLFAIEEVRGAISFILVVLLIIYACLQCLACK